MLFFRECETGVARGDHGDEYEWAVSRVCRAMHLAGQRYGDVSGFQTGNDAVALTIFGLTRDHRPGVLAMGMDMRGDFLPWMGVPDNNRRVRCF